MASMAYTAVETSRQGLAAPQEEPQPKIQWSEPVRDYVSRAFAEENTVEGVSKEEMSVRLKEVIGGMARQGLLESTRWETMPLPQQLIQQERVHAAYAAAWHYQSHLQANPLGLSPLIQKRRHDDTHDDMDSNVSPWGSSPGGGLESRITYDNKQSHRAEKRQKKSFSPQEPSRKFQDELEQRRRRFELDNHSQSPPRNRFGDYEERIQPGPIVGTNQNLEKSYFRLTAPPKPFEVRPLDVLKKTFKLLQDKYKTQTRHGDGPKYPYINDQFKSLRQDLTVQRIKNSFTVDVYELHARIALEQGDMGEYNQCQTQLRSLYSLNLGGNPAEFLAYRILYFVLTANRTDMNRLLSELTEHDKTFPAVKHALDSRAAVASGNYHKLFRLYLDAPGMGPYLMDKFVERERILALVKICAAYSGPHCELPLRYITEELGFESDNHAVEFIHKFVPDYSKFVETRSSSEEPNKLFFLSNSKDVKQLLESSRKDAYRKIDIKGQI